MKTESEFKPRWSSAPGVTILDALQERGISVQEFSNRLGQVGSSVEALLEGRAPITLGLARELSRVIGGSVEFWLARDFQYRDDIGRLRQDEEREWLGMLPVGDMIRFGWLRPIPHPAIEPQACLKFFGVSDLSTWRERYAGIMDAAAFKTTRAFESRPGAVAAWLRQGEIQAQGISCNDWDRTRFLEALRLARKLTRQKDPAKFLPRLVRYCAEAGVAVVIVRAPAGCRASGATFFRPDNRAVLSLSFRYLSDDHFWFTFFHEAGHLLLHGRDRIFIEDAGLTQLREVEEGEADAFSAEWLVPRTLRDEMMRLAPRTEDVLRFSAKAGVAPGVIVGQLQHAGRLGRDKLNGLKRKYSWPKSFSLETP